MQFIFYRNSSDSLYISEDFGFTWKQIQVKVGYFSWDVEGVNARENYKNIFILRNEPSELSTILSSNNSFSDQPKVWLTEVEEIEINGRFIFATRRLRLFGTHNPSHQLWISVDRKPFYRALISSNLQPINYHIADVTSEIIFLCVAFSDGSTHLYTSGMLY